MAGHGKLRDRIGSSRPDPFRVGDMLGDLLQDAQQTLYLAASADVWEDHQAQRLVRANASPVRAILSGNRWGKSDWGARECRYWMLGDHPYLSEYITLPTRGWATSDRLDSAQDITIPKLIQHIPYEAVRHFPTRERKYFELTNGSRLSVKSIEQGRGAFQGTGDDFHWWDDIEGEQPDAAWECYKEGGMRIQAGRRLWTWITMTPVMGRTPLIESLLALQAKGEAFLYQGSIHDNPHLTVEAKDRALSGITERWELEAREHGKITLLGGGYLFNIDRVNCMIARGEPHFTWSYVIRNDKGNVQLMRGEEPTTVNHLAWKVWSPPLPGHRYVVFIDPGGGGLGEEDDWTVLKVFDADTLEECACLRSKLTPKPTAKQGRLISVVYNHALLGIEANAMGLGVIDNARQYPRLYRRHQIADFEPKSGSKIGWHTSEALKEKMVNDLVELVDGEDISLRELETWREMLHFIRFPDRSIGARKGWHDDGIMCTAGAVQLILSPKLDSYFDSVVLYTPGQEQEDDDEQVTETPSGNESPPVDDTPRSDSVLLPTRPRVADPGVSTGDVSGLWGAPRGGKVWGA